MDAAAYRMCFDEDQLATLCAQYDRRIDSLGAENARLRKIAREQRTCIWHGDDCDGCPHKDPSGICKAHFWDEYRILMDEEEEDDGQ